MEPNMQTCESDSGQAEHASNLILQNEESITDISRTSDMDIDKGQNKDSLVNEPMENTAKEVTNTSHSVGNEIMAGPSDASDSSELHSIKIKMLARVSVSSAHFKHQQRGDPDLTLQDKIEIAQSVLETSNVSFLARFGEFLGIEDLTYFSDLRTSSYEIDFYCKQIEKRKSKNYSKNQVKNRRYQALKELISQDEYFSEEEMKYRDPYLYHQMVGQYLTDDEIKAGIDKSDLKFSSILVKHIDQLNENDRFTRDKDKEEGQEEEEEDSDEDEEEMEESASEKKGGDNSDGEEDKIPEERRQELKAEFLTIMQERFLMGQDKNFNYSQVDNNEAYDDLTVLGHDAEEKYFDDEDPESIHSDSNM